MKLEPKTTPKTASKKPVIKLREMQVDYLPDGPYGATYIRLSLPSLPAEIPIGLIIDEDIVTGLLQEKDFSSTLVIGQTFGNQTLLTVMTCGGYTQLYAALRQELTPTSGNPSYSGMLTTALMRKYEIPYIVLSGVITDQAHFVMLGQHWFFDHEWPQAVSETLETLTTTTADGDEVSFKRAADYDYLVASEVTTDYDYRFERLRQEPDWKDDCDCEVCVSRRTVLGKVTRDEMLNSLKQVITARDDNNTRRALMYTLGDDNVVMPKTTSGVTLKA